MSSCIRTKVIRTNDIKLTEIMTGKRWNTLSDALFNVHWWYIMWRTYILYILLLINIAVNIFCTFYFLSIQQ